MKGFRINTVAAVKTTEITIEGQRAKLEAEIEASAEREGFAARQMTYGHGVTKGRPGRKRQATSISCPRHRKELGKLVAVG